ncbi:MAG: hypothetical protein FWH05_04250 [Oscillospiraceae bacterium]|nr:hypothetical protein [Oscillospiraceae bacterium]
MNIISVNGYEPYKTYESKETNELKRDESETLDEQRGAEDEKAENFDKPRNDLRDRFSTTNENSDKLTAEMKKVTLNGLLKRVEMMQSNMYSGRSWKQLMKIYGITKAVSLNDEATAEELEKAIRDLTAAITALKKSQPDDKKHREMLPLTIKPGGTAREQSKNANAKTVFQTTNSTMNIMA